MVTDTVISSTFNDGGWEQFQSIKLKNVLHVNDLK